MKLNHVLTTIFVPLLLTVSAPAHLMAQTPTERKEGTVGELAAQFRTFLQSYWPGIRKRNRTYLQSVHPKLPEEMYDFFFDVTQNMMRHSDEVEGVEPKIECQEFSVCKVIYPQPNNSWAAQTFIYHDGAWRWLDT